MTFDGITLEIIFPSLLFPSSCQFILTRKREKFDKNRERLKKSFTP
jgi:hypothetical protein